MFITPDRVDGGAERVFTLLANTLVKAEHEVTFVQYAFKDSDYPLDARVNLVAMPKYRVQEKAITGIPRRAYYLRKIMRKYQPDVVIPILAYTQIEAFIASQGLKTKLISAIRNNPARSPVRKAERIVRDILCAFSDGIMVQTETQKNYFPQCLRKKIIVVSNPIGEQFLDITWRSHGGIRQIINVGRLIAQKNQSVFLESMKDIHQKYPKIKGVIYGEGPDRNNQNTKIKELKLEDVVELRGQVSDIQMQLLDCDLFVLCSNFEGFPNALIEAMAMGLPSISTDCPTGPAEIIDSGRNGLLIPVNDTKSLTEAIEWMICHYEEAVEMGKQGRDYVCGTMNAEAICNYLVKQCSMIVERKRHEGKNSNSL